MAFVLGLAGALGLHGRGGGGGDPGDVGLAGRAGMCGDPGLPPQPADARGGGGPLAARAAPRQPLRRRGHGATPGSPGLHHVRKQGLVGRGSANAWAENIPQHRRAGAVLLPLHLQRGRPRASWCDAGRSHAPRRSPCRSTPPGAHVRRVAQASNRSHARRNDCDARHAPIACIEHVRRVPPMGHRASLTLPGIRGPVEPTWPGHSAAPRVTTRHAACAATRPVLTASRRDPVRVVEKLAGVAPTLLHRPY